MVRFRRTLFLSLLLASTANAHDVSLDVGSMFTSTSENNPRTGGASINLAGTFDVSDALSIFGNAQYTRDLPTRTSESASPGSDIFLFGLGAAVAPSHHWLFMASATGSPPSIERNATLVVNATTGAKTDVVVNSRAWSFGGLALASWASAGLSDLEHIIDAVFSVTHFEVFQQLEIGNTLRAQQARSICDALGPRNAFCSLVLGASTPLTQFKFGAAYTAVLAVHTDLGLEGAYYLYDKNPSTVGYFSLVMLGRIEVGAGVPVLPLQLSVRPSLMHRFERVTLRVAYQFGLYPSGEGSNHALSAKATWKISDAWRLWLSASAQLDATGGTVNNPAGTAALGALVEF